MSGRFDPHAGTTPPKRYAIQHSPDYFTAGHLPAGRGQVLLGIHDLPHYLAEFEADPLAEIPAERAQMREYVRDWTARGNFVLDWDEEYKMTADGEVEST